MLRSFQNPLEGNVRQCANLVPERVAENSKSQVSALAAASLKLKIPGNFTPVGPFGHHLIVYDAEKVYAADPEGGTAEAIALLQGRKVLFGLQSSDGKEFMLATDSDYLIIKPAPGGVEDDSDSTQAENDSATIGAAAVGWVHEWVSKEAAGMPYFSAKTGMPCEVSVGGRALSYAYTGMEAVRAVDARNLTADMVEAYRQIANQSAAAGDFLQPTLVRYRLLDSEGREIFSSPHLLVGEAAGCEIQTVNFADSLKKSTAPYTLSGSGTALSLHIPSSSQGIFARMAARLEVVASPMLQPYQPGAPTHCKRKVNAHGDEFAVLRLPGSSYGQFSPLSASAPAMLERLIATGAKERVLTVVDDPFGAAAGSRIAVRSSGASIDSEIADLRAVMALEPKRLSTAEALLRAPHRISAKVTASASGLTLAGGVKAERFRGWELPVLATDHSGSDLWQAVVSVIFADGTRLSMPAQGMEGAPIKISPVVSYPAPEVASIAIQLAVQGQPLRVMSLPMTTDASHGRSVYVAPELRCPQWREVEGLLTLPADTAAPVDFPSMVVVSGQGSLMHVHAVAGVGGEVRALQPASRALGAWDFGRARFLCGGEGGIHALTVNAGRNAVAVNLLHPGVVERAEAMTQALDGEVAVIASGDLLTVHGSTVSTRIAGLGSGSLAWHAPGRSLWFVPEAGGEVRAMFPEFRYRGCTMPCREADSVLTMPSGVVAIGGEGISLPAKAAEEAVDVAWAGVLPGPWRGRLRLTIPLSAAYFDGTVSVCHRHLEGDEAVMAKYGVCGSVHSPLVMNLFVPPCDALMIKITGTTAGGCTLRPPHAT